MKKAVILLALFLGSCAMESCPTYSTVRKGTAFNENKPSKSKRKGSPYYKVGKFAERD